MIRAIIIKLFGIIIGMTLAGVSAFYYFANNNEPPLGLEQLSFNDGFLFGILLMVGLYIFLYSLEYFGDK